MGDQPEIPGKSVTDLLTQVFLRVAGPAANSNPYRREDDPGAPDEDHDAPSELGDDEEWEYVETYEDAPADHDEGREDDAEDGRSRRRDDNDLFRI